MVIEEEKEASKREKISPRLDSDHGVDLESSSRLKIMSFTHKETPFPYGQVSHPR